MSDVASPVERSENGRGGEARSAAGRAIDNDLSIAATNAGAQATAGPAEERVVEGEGRRTVMTAEETAQ